MIAPTKKMLISFVLVAACLLAGVAAQDEERVNEIMRKFYSRNNRTDISPSELRRKAAIKGITITQMEAYRFIDDFTPPELVRFCDIEDPLARLDAEIEHVQNAIHSATKNPLTDRDAQKIRVDHLRQLRKEKNDLIERQDLLERQERQLAQERQDLLEHREVCEGVVDCAKADCTKGGWHWIHNCQRPCTRCQTTQRRRLVVSAQLIAAHQRFYDQRGRKMQPFELVAESQNQCTLGEAFAYLRNWRPQPRPQETLGELVARDAGLDRQTIQREFRERLRRANGGQTDTNSRNWSDA